MALFLLPLGPPCQGPPNGAPMGPRGELASALHPQPRGLPLTVARSEGWPAPGLAGWARFLGLIWLDLAWIWLGFRLDSA